MSLLHWYSTVNMDTTHSALPENDSESLLMGTMLWIGMIPILRGLKPTIKQIASPASQCHELKLYIYQSLYAIYKLNIKLRI